MDGQLDDKDQQDERGEGEHGGGTLDSVYGIVLVVDWSIPTKVPNVDCPEIRRLLPRSGVTSSCPAPRTMDVAHERPTSVSKQMHRESPGKH